MNSKSICDMQNTFGRFIQYYNLNQLNLAKALFSDALTAHLWLPDRNIDATGKEQIESALQAIDRKRRAAEFRRDIHVPHTPAFLMDGSGSTVYGSWDVFSFEGKDDSGNTQMEYFYTRIDGIFIPENGIMKILSLDWYEITSFIPWEYDPLTDDGLNAVLSSFPLPPACSRSTDPADFYVIQNVLTRFVHNNRKYAMKDTFAMSPDVSFRMPPVTPFPVNGTNQIAMEMEHLTEMEMQNLGKYICVPTTSCPVIEVSETGDTARGQWMASVISLEGEAFGRTPGNYLFVRRIGILTADFVHEPEGWRILKFDLNNLLTLPGIPYDAHCEPGKPAGGKRFQRVGLTENRWKPALPKMSGIFSDDVVYLESRMAFWVNAYRRGEMVSYIKENMLNDEFETIFTSRMMGRQSPPVVGSDAMIERFNIPVFQYHHQQTTCHGGMSPDVEISADGRYATVTYFDMNTTAYDPSNNSNFSNDDSFTLNIEKNWNADTTKLSYTPCYLQFSKYEHHFAKVDGIWKHIRVDWETVVSLPDILLAGKNARGWAGSITDFKFPAIGEKYRYSPVRKIEKK